MFILLVANALQPSMTGPDNSLLGGMILILVLIGTNFLIGRLDRISRLHELFSGSPTVIIKNGKFVAGALKKEGVTTEEAEMEIREHGVEDLKDVELGVLEPDGTISIVPTAGANPRKSRRRVRFLRRPN